ncbi:phosphoribosylformylglycinamidine synthase subunit PurL [Natronomonas pharaonis DSM 2160]|uniref:Phosphoribosylformylglycinamidine synthase subunit PurL n=1 Tax=Natronomonas pharaonis (strain ATCC 35678 / DSM 2160 / CIP 103997 / JCM 8858 / NBRC 14720 / NCIMB 2260 / Gabara) TaxID=348780 RepID=PURL_NATPD|nr:phosphoribosylformylglycinamidine synthase subunit PurL [Natronomonas pharaonis]Q3IQL3.1 RecName: Full=Phosphoribosylformylglycinamidine synthase subunit PurL; Short=FGAM synthase; AltName: Full=Formylglycinamide ribonucleotide amidotransferase subunit II; Short=FGAR amidotransferase II; Short=FGAR-AT II; AltName: Full=Glutamine amidotransferase PurL; AltName: Full=Phosphoribosylformylglycinamidine synthase subunit II [Natronomonas pharaonis DSM 2160]CAI49582.1 phosphoribosylformylglycinamidin
MSLSPSDRELVTEELGREPTPAEEALFENLWSEHCAYRSSQPLLSAFESEGDRVVVGPGDDAAVVALPDPETGENSDTYITMGIESHNHPSYVDPFDGAATGVGGIVRDTMSMGAYPIALADSLYFGDFDREHSKYLFEGVVEGISHYGNCIGVPTVTGSVAFHDDYEGNPLVNVACVGLTDDERLVTAEAQTPGNKLVLFGNATGRDGLGGASFASEDLDEDAETEDRPAVQVGDPYAEKRLIEANEELVDDSLVRAARDLGAAGLGGASSELVAKGGLGAHIELDRVHQREPNMNALEILLAESQERMCYEVRPEDVDAVAAVADKYDLGCSVIGDVTDGNYVCTFDGETVVDCDAEYLADGAPMNDLDHVEPTQPDRDRPSPDLETAFEAVVAAPNTASKEWVYRQYDHEVGTRTALKPGDDAALMAVREAGVGLAFSSGADPNWTDTAPYDGARAVALENATNIAAKGALPLAAVDCLNGGNPEKPDVYGGFRGIVNGLADMCSTLDVPVVGGNVSLYNDSPSGPIPPTPTLAMTGTKPGYDAPPAALSGDGDLLVVGDGGDLELGGSELLAQFGGSDQFPALPDSPAAFIEAVADIADLDSTHATHDVSHGGLAVALAELVGDAGADVDLAGSPDALSVLFSEAVGRVVVETTDPEAVKERLDGVAPVEHIGHATDSGRLELSVGDETLSYSAADIASLRSVIGETLE